MRYFSRFFSRIRKDIRVVFERDPAAKSVLEVVLCYSGLHAIWIHRISHEFYLRGWIVFARLLSNFGRFMTGIEIHPGAKIGPGLFIDHGTGIVIGETAEIGRNVTLYQGVTLGGTGKESGKRHPTLGNNVVVASGAKVLGSFKVGDHAKIGAGSVVLKEVPPYATVVGIPGRVVVLHGRRIHNAEDYRDAVMDFCTKRGYDLNDPEVYAELCDEIDVDLDHNILPDPETEMIQTMSRQIQRLEDRIRILEKRLAEQKPIKVDSIPILPSTTDGIPPTIAELNREKMSYERQSKNVSLDKVETAQPARSGNLTVISTKKNPRPSFKIPDDDDDSEIMLPAKNLSKTKENLNAQSLQHDDEEEGRISPTAKR